MAKMIFTLPGGLKVERDNNFGIDPYGRKGIPIAPTPTPAPTPKPTPTPTPEPSPAPTPDPPEVDPSPDSEEVTTQQVPKNLLEKAAEVVEEVVKPKARRGRPKKNSGAGKG